MIVRKETKKSFRLHLEPRIFWLVEVVLEVVIIKLPYGLFMLLLFSLRNYVLLAVFMLGTLKSSRVGHKCVPVYGVPFLY